MALLDEEESWFDPRRGDCRADISPLMFGSYAFSDLPSLFALSTTRLLTASKPRNLLSDAIDHRACSAASLSFRPPPSEACRAGGGACGHGMAHHYR